MEAAAARSHVHLPPPSRRAKRPRTTTSSREANRRRRHPNITKLGRRRPHHLLRPCSSSHPPIGGRSAHAQLLRRSVPAKISTCCSALAVHFLPPALRSRSAMRLPSQQNVSSSQPPNYWGAKRGRTSQLPCLNNWRDWANLDDGPAGLIAERVLAYDVADYLRFRAVCRPWRRCSVDLRAHDGLDRRFHPRRWILLREQLAAPERRCFLNTSTGECVQVDIPELHDHELLAVTPEGLLVLLHKPPCNTVYLLNPLTRHLTQLPPLTTLLPSEDHDMLSEDYGHVNTDFAAWGSGIADDDSTVVLCLDRLCMLGMAKPGDDHWRLLEYHGYGMSIAPLMFAGRFYSVDISGVMVLEAGPDQPPRLEVAAKLENMHVSPIVDSFHLINNFGELMLVHRRRGSLTAGNELGWCYDMYRVDLDTGTLLPVKSLGGAGRALFIGKDCSLSVSLEVFPSGSISADTMYLSFDMGERIQLEAEAYDLADGSVQLPCSLVPRPHTLVDCLCLSNTATRNCYVSSII